MHTIRSKYSYTPYTEAYEPSNVDFALDELREHRDIKIDELRDLFETAYKDKVCKGVICLLAVTKDMQLSLSLGTVVVFVCFF